MNANIPHSYVPGERLRLEAYTRIAAIYFFFNDTATTEIYTLSLHDALPIIRSRVPFQRSSRPDRSTVGSLARTRLLDLNGRVLDPQPLGKPRVNRPQSVAVRGAGREVRVQRDGRSLAGNGPDVHVMYADESGNVAAELRFDMGDIESRPHTLQQYIGRFSRDRPRGTQDQR